MIASKPATTQISEGGSENGASTWLTVRALAAHEYCPRAGLIGLEEESHDYDDFEAHPRLDYLPDYSIHMLEQGLQAIWTDIWRCLTWASPVALAVFLFGYFWNASATLAVVPLAWWLAKRLVRQLRNVAELSRRLEAARRATPVEPDFRADQPQEVNWWDLLAAGFTAVEYEDSHEDPNLKLSGRPWRVLHKGSLRVPVFRKRRGKSQIRRQHEVRMAAYCHLVEAAEGGEAPYGVVLFNDGYDGVTVPYDRSRQQVLHESIEAFRRTLNRLSVTNQHPGPPKDAHVCEGCALGYPRVYRRGAVEIRMAAGPCSPHLTRAVDGRLYHSPCGDRYQWVPPHERAIEKGLRP